MRDLFSCVYEPGPNGIGRGWVVRIIAPAYAGEFEYSYTERHLARSMVCGYVSTEPVDADGYAPFSYAFYAW